MQIGLITCRQLPEPDPDQDLLRDSLADHGVSADWVAWDDPDADWASYDHCVLRSTWNYPEVCEKFVSWLDKAAGQTDLWNPADLVRWNMHKSYLVELAAKGIPTVPTCCVPKGRVQDLTGLSQENDWASVVVKPAISAGSWLTRKFDEPGAGQAFFEASVGERDTLVQPFIPSAARGEEAAIVAIDGEVTHVVQKRTRFDGDDESVSEARLPTDAELALARRVLAEVRVPTLYARVDVMPDTDGALLLAELELIEPSLFLLQWPPALRRIVESIAGLGVRDQS